MIFFPVKLHNQASHTCHIFYTLHSLYDITKIILKSTQLGETFVLCPCEFFKSIFPSALQCQQGQNKFLLEISILDFVYIHERKSLPFLEY